MRGAEGEGGAVRGGNIYWGRKEVTDFKGVVVIFTWVSVPHTLLPDFVDLYSSLRWNSIVCYAHYLSAKKAVFRIKQEFLRRYWKHPYSAVHLCKQISRSWYS